jgi:hypothetical protein
MVIPSDLNKAVDRIRILQRLIEHRARRNRSPLEAIEGLHTVHSLEQRRAETVVRAVQSYPSTITVLR